MDLILDRSLEDVKLGRAKGYYNAGDLNRVGVVTAGLSSELLGCGYGVAVSAKTNWQPYDLPKRSQMAVYLGNIQALKRGFYVLPTTPDLPISIDKLDWVAANHIEQNLADLQVLKDWLVQSFIYSGQIFCAER